MPREESFIINRTIKYYQMHFFGFGYDDFFYLIRITPVKFLLHRNPINDEHYVQYATQIDCNMVFNLIPRQLYKFYYTHSFKIFSNF